MLTGIIKIILFSALLYLIYSLFLEKEKINRFKRFYLLFAIVFPFVIPFISITTGWSFIHITEPVSFPGGITVHFTENGASQSVTNAIIDEPKNPLAGIIPAGTFLFVLYLIVTIFLLGRFTRNLLRIWLTIKNNEIIPYFDAKIVLTKDKCITHSFLKYIFVNKDDYEKGEIEKTILSHELTHVKEKHSLDILFVEFILALAWINPILFLFRKAMRLNHEFLADESVVKKICNTDSYQILLLNELKQANGFAMSCPFNYLSTKKRIIMISKEGPGKSAVLKQIVLIPLIIFAAFLFTAKSTATYIPADTLQLSDKESGLKQLPAETQTPEGLAEFLILIETRGDETIITGKKGCEWNRLGFNFNGSKAFIDQNGVFRDENSLRSSSENSIEFIISIKRTENGVSLEGLKGTAWNSLYFPQDRGDIFIAINQLGKTESGE